MTEEPTYTMQSWEESDGTLRCVWVCLDCGANGPSPETVIHYRTCDPGSHKRWEEHHWNQEEQEEKDENYRRYLEENDSGTSHRG